LKDFAGGLFCILAPSTAPTAIIFANFKMSTKNNHKGTCTDRAVLELVVAKYEKLKGEGGKVSNRIVAKETDGLIGCATVGKILNVYRQTGSIESLDPSVRKIRCLNREQHNFLKALVLKALVLTDPNMCLSGLQRKISEQFGLWLDPTTIRRMICNLRPSSSPGICNYLRNQTQIEEYPKNSEYIGRKLSFKGKVRVVKKVDLLILNNAKLGLTEHAGKRFSLENRLKRIEMFGHENI
jgi:transposase